ncbi:MAG: methyltransferase domain-containing protein [Nitriliruptor sp.]
MRALVEEHLEAGRPTGWFEPVYAASGGDAGAVPWGGDVAHPYVLDWLADPVVAPPGRRAVVVGCGLGGDAAAVHGAGYDVVAFDVAPSAVAWARDRLPPDVDVQVADLLDLPDGLVGGFDLVVEVRTVQSLPGVVRDAAMHAVASLAGPAGVVVVVTLLATSARAAADAEGPPWPQAPSELAAYLAGSLRRVALEHPDPSGEDALDVRCTFVREGAEGAPSTLMGDAQRDVLGIPGADPA